MLIILKMPPNEAAIPAKLFPDLVHGVLVGVVDVPVLVLDHQEVLVDPQPVHVQLGVGLYVRVREIGRVPQQEHDPQVCREP